MPCELEQLGRPSGSHRKGGEFWPPAAEGTTEDSEKLPGFVSTLLSHTGMFETRRQVGGGRGPFPSPFQGHSLGTTEGEQARPVKEGCGEASRGYSCSLRLDTTSSPQPALLSRDAVPHRSRVLETLADPVPEFEGSI